VSWKGEDDTGGSKGYGLRWVGPKEELGRRVQKGRREWAAGVGVQEGWVLGFSPIYKNLFFSFSYSNYFETQFGTKPKQHHNLFDV
jgi:hypothetical protein